MGGKKDGKKNKKRKRKSERKKGERNGLGMMRGIYRYNCVHSLHTSDDSIHTYLHTSIVCLTRKNNYLLRWNVFWRNFSFTERKFFTHTWFAIGLTRQVCCIIWRYSPRASRALGNKTDLLVGIRRGWECERETELQKRDGDPMKSCLLVSQIFLGFLLFLFLFLFSGFYESLTRNYN